MIPNSIKTLNLFPRTILPSIEKWIDDRLALVLTGSRQVGKTSTLYLLIQNLIKKNIPPENLFYFDLEKLAHFQLIENGAESLINFLRFEGANLEGKIFIFIDEIQYLSDPSNFLKLIVDHYPQIKIICTGSSSLDIRRKFKDSLVGRKMIFEIYGLSFAEFLYFKNERQMGEVLKKNNLTNILKNENLNQAIPDIYTTALQSAFNEYCQFGGYPAIVLEPVFEKKISLLNEIYDAYVHKDVRSLFKIENIPAFNQLCQMTAIAIGNLQNINTFADDLGVSRSTLDNYLTMLENTYIIRRLTPFFKRKKREVIKMPKIFWMDIGLRNLVIKQFNEPGLRNDRGAIVENFIYVHLLRELPVLWELNFWRTKNSMEVDFICQTPEGLIPIEVKHRSFKQPTLPSGIKSFIQTYPVETAVVITKDFLFEARISGTRVLFIPAHLFYFLS